MHKKSKYPLSYYPIQALLAFFGIAIGFGFAIFLDTIGMGGYGKPGGGFFLLLFIPAASLVWLHRAYVTDRLGDEPHELIDLDEK